MSTAKVAVTASLAVAGGILVLLLGGFVLAAAISGTGDSGPTPADPGEEPTTGDSDTAVAMTATEVSHPEDTHILVTITNNGDDEIGVNPLLGGFEVVDTDGYVHQVDPALEADTMDATELRPGQSTEGVIVVEGDIDPEEVEFTTDAGLGETYVAPVE